LKKYICIRGWKRNPTNDIIEEWEYNKLPQEIKDRHFKEYEEPKPVEKPVIKAVPVLEKAIDFPTIEVPVVTPPIEDLNPKKPFKGFKGDDFK